MNAAEVLIADYGNPGHGRDIVRLLDCYARDPMGGARGLSDSVKERLVDELAAIPGAVSLLAYVDGKAAGLVNCLRGFSTFQCQPLLNIHDVVVEPEFRGQGICGQLLEAVETYAREEGFCKLTLEVLEGNLPARQAYRSRGFTGYQLDPETGSALFWQKTLV